ncbi:MAG: IS982 family transposase [Micrococcales bacterium]|nr:IS982 family transposase [Micrococcales bacterium]
MDTCLDTLAVALYVTVDDLLVANPHERPARPRTGLVPKVSDSEMITLAVVGALLGFTDEARWVRWARAHLRSYFPFVPQQPGYNKRLRKLAGTIRWVCDRLARSTDQWCDGTWVVDSTPVEAARSKETVKRSDLAGYAEYGYCASHSRYFWGFRLHLVCTLSGLPVGYALTGAKTDERQTLLSILDGTEHRPGQIIIADKNYHGASFEQTLADQGVVLVRKARKGEAPRPGGQFFKPLRQTVESINATSTSSTTTDAPCQASPCASWSRSSP